MLAYYLPEYTMELSTALQCSDGIKKRQPHRDEIFRSKFLEIECGSWSLNHPLKRHLNRKRTKRTPAIVFPCLTFPSFPGLTSKHAVGGVIALSCWLPLHKDFPKAAADASRLPNLPVLQCHGDCDPVVPFKWGQMTSSILKKFLPRHEFKSFAGLGHSSSPDELDEIRSFLKSVCDGL